MSEERVPYTTPDEVAARLGRMEAYIKQLENTNDGLAMIIGRRAETIKRLEHDNKRLRHLDAMPVDAIQRLHANTTYSHEYAPSDGYSVPQYDEDCAVVNEWLATLDGAA